jgi:hypothetical protein
MDTNILNGDALIDRMEAAGFGNLISCREALIDGPVNATSMDEFWKMRAAFIEDIFEEEEVKYYDHVVTEFDKMKEIAPGSNINLWFGDDLFCQANLWFVVNYLDQLGLSGNLYRVFPIIKFGEDRWAEFGNLDPGDFGESYDARMAFTKHDVVLAENLWNAYAAGNFKTLQALSTTPTDVFHDLDKVVQAHIDRFPQSGELSRPEKTLKEIMDSGVTDFSKIFPAFFNREGIYGFGDVQVKGILANMK